MPLTARPPFALLAFDGLAPPGSELLFERPRAVLEAREPAEIAPLLAAVERGTEAGAHAVGWLAYEAAPAFDPAFVVRRPGDLPLAWFGLFDPPRAIAVAGSDPRSDEEDDDAGWTAEAGEADYACAIGEIRQAIARGEVYQANYTLRLRRPLTGEPLALFRRMQSRQRGGYAAYFDLGTHCILSASPELFFRRNGREVVTRPMKGTARRGRWAAEDAAIAAALAESPKERAENVMIVDLLRNDLGRVAVPGSVTVAALCQVERYPTVLQLTSTISATLRAEVPLSGLIGALFPSGSVTGAPKISAMSLIAELESSPRGAYCGSIGYVAPGADAVFSVAIRTATADRGTGLIEYGAGGGITWDSRADSEHAELLAKAAIATAPWPPFDLLETLRLEQGRYRRLEQHLVRLAASAAYFDRPADLGAIRARLDAAAADHPAGCRRVRLLVDPLGKVSVEVAPLEPAPESALVSLAAEPVDSTDPFLCHKTTRRTVYQRRRAARPDRFDVLLVNERGELTEFTIGNLVVELSGERWTPPRECGLLPGVFRAELIRSGAVRERVLRPEMLPGAAIWLVNSLREWLPVTLAP